MAKVKCEDVLKYLWWLANSERGWKQESRGVEFWLQEIGGTQFATQNQHGYSDHALRVKEGTEKHTDTVWAWIGSNEKKTWLGHYNTNHGADMTSTGMKWHVYMPYNMAKVVWNGLKQADNPNERRGSDDRISSYLMNSERTMNGSKGDGA